MTEPSEDRYVLNVNPGGQDVLHHNPGERCNTDDATGRLSIDADTARALLATDQARSCEHCNSEEEPS